MHTNLIEAAAKLPPPLVVQHRGRLDTHNRIDEIHAWGTGLVTVRHGIDFPLESILPPVAENDFLVGALAGQIQAAKLLGKDRYTIAGNANKAFRVLKVSSSRAALRQLFDPEVGGLEVTEPVELDNEPSPQLVEFMEILAMGKPYPHNGASFSKYWTESTFTKKLRSLQTELGVANSAAVLFWGFASNILGPESTLLRQPRANQQKPYRAYSLQGPSLTLQQWSPPPRSEVMPEMGARHTYGFSITHSEARDGSVMHFPHDVLLPLDAALTFRGHNLHIGRISGVELLGGRVRINRSHELLNKLTESDLRHLGAACLGLNGAQSVATFYETGDGCQQRGNLRRALEMARAGKGMRRIVDRAFQVGLLVVEKSLDFDLGLLPDYFPDVVRHAPSALYEDVAHARGVSRSTARHMIRKVCAQLQVTNRAAIVTVGRLRKLI